jgi:hypothetical protein
MDFLARNSRPHNESCSGALSLVTPEFGSFPPSRLPQPSSVISLTPDLRSELTTVHTVSTFAFVPCVFCRPLLGSSCTSSRLSLNCLCHSRPLHFLPVFTQTWCLSAAPDSCHSFFHGHVLLSLLLGNERLIWSIGYVNASSNHVQTFLGTWVCLTQHPSDTLRPFRELSRLTMYILPHWSHTGWVRGCWISAPL